MELTPYEIKTLINCLPKDKNGITIMPWRTYKTINGVSCRPRIRIDFDVTVLDGYRHRTCTEADVVQDNE